MLWSLTTKYLALHCSNFCLSNDEIFCEIAFCSKVVGLPNGEMCVNSSQQSDFSLLAGKIALGTDQSHYQQRILSRCLRLFNGEIGQTLILREITRSFQGCEKADLVFQWLSDSTDLSKGFAVQCRDSRRDTTATHIRI